MLEYLFYFNLLKKLKIKLEKILKLLIKLIKIKENIRKRWKKI